MHIAIIGGGITGLSAAWELQKCGIRYTLLEASDRWGGKVISSKLELKDGAHFLVEGGPDTIITRKPEAWELATELRMLDQITNPGSETSGTYVLDHASLHPIPVSPARFFSTHLLSLRGKLRLLAEPFQPARRDYEDESLADFVRRRLGQEALDKFIGPVLGGIYNTDPETQSIMVSSPIMREMEKDGGGLFAGALKRMLRGKKNKAPRFVSFKNGLQALTDELVRQLTGDLRLNAPVKKVTRLGNGYQIFIANETTVRADGVIFATLANQTSAMIKELSAEASQQLITIRHQNIGTLSLVYLESDIPKEPIISGLMIPRREKRMIDAVTFTSRKMPERSTAGYAVVRVFIGGGAPEIVEFADDKLIETVQKELTELLGITAAPQTWTVFRWQSGFPQAEVGHLKHIDKIEKLLPPNLALAGSSYRGIAVPDCIRQGREAARKLSNPAPT
jgi:protoporphyrinogen/coproporphyrinogen III oxidase